MHVHLPKPLHGWRAFVGEVGIIVIGVLIALGAEQLVELVRSHQEEHERLERLFEEARADVAQLRGFRDSFGHMTARETQFAVELTRGACPPADLWDAPTTVNIYPSVIADTSVYDEVVGAGGLASIRSMEARKAVSNFHAMLTWVSRQIEFFRSNRAKPVEMDDPRVTVSLDPRAREPEVYNFDRSALCNDHGFRNRMIEAVRDHETAYRYRSRLTDRAIKMCGALGHVLGKECTPSDGPPLSGAERGLAAAGAAGRT